MAGMSLAILLTLLGCALGQVPHWNPVQPGFIFPFNTTNNHSVYPSAYNSQYFPMPINISSYQPPAYNPYLPPPYPVQQNFTSQWNNFTVYNNPYNKVVYGARRPYDKLLLKTIITKAAPIIFGTTTTKELKFPDPNSKQRFNTITEIVLTNNKPNNTDFSTEIQKGGVGKSSVQLRLKTKSKYGLDVSLELWGN